MRRNGMDEIEGVAREAREERGKEREGEASNDNNTNGSTNPIGQNIETVANLHIHMEKKVDRHQRSIESFTAFLGRPRFLYIIFTFVCLWIFTNVALETAGCALLIFRRFIGCKALLG